MSAIATYDLHLHTYWSYDADTEPVRYFEQARALGVKCMAITEHHVLDSLPELREIAKDYPDVIFVPSAELSVTTSIGSVDLLCFGFPPALSTAVTDMLAAYHAWQRAYGAAVSAGLSAIGCPFSDEERLALLKTYRPEKAVQLHGATHVKVGIMRQFCVDRGYMKSFTEWGGLMERAAQAVPFPDYPHVRDVVPTVKASGARVAIAHPHVYFNYGDVERMDQLRLECGLDGIECAHSAVPGKFIPVYRDYCEQHDLFSTGGSDCHSVAEMGKGFAGHGGPDEWLEEFLERIHHTAN